jgi:predicted metal-dependent peptidase
MTKIKLKVVDEREFATANKRMEWAIGFMVVRYHFVYQILGMMHKQASIATETMGVWVGNGGSFELRYNPLFVNSLTDAALTYVFYHEVLHLALHHCTHRSFDDKELSNIAHDLAVNELIPITPGSCEPPRKPDGSLMGCFVSELKKMKEYSDIQEKQTCEWYYDYLKQKAKKAKKASGGGGKGKAGGQSGSKIDDHGGWKENEVADEIVRAKIDEIAKGDLWGDVGGAEKELILAAQQKKINWRNLLRQFYGQYMSPDSESTRKRPNRRTGYIHPGSRRLMLDRHLVAVDTSGSIDSDLLAQFLGVINQMTDYVPIDLMQCDCGVTDTPRPFDRRKCQFEFKGRGGTDFNPIMKIVNERHYKSVVILTDGAAAECLKPNAQVVWVLPTGNEPPVEWGKRIHMNRHV